MINIIDYIKEQLDVPRKDVVMGEHTVSIIALSEDATELVKSSENPYIEAIAYGLCEGVKPLYQVGKYDIEEMKQLIAEFDEDTTVLSEEILALSSLEELIEVDELEEIDGDNITEEQLNTPLGQLN